MLGTTKRPHIFKDTSSFQVQVCLIMSELLEYTRKKRVNKRFENKKLENVQIMYITHIMINYVY